MAVRRPRDRFVGDVLAESRGREAPAPSAEAAVDCKALPEIVPPPGVAMDTPVPDSTDADMLRDPMLGRVCMGTP